MIAVNAEYGIKAGSPKSFLQAMHGAGVLKHFVDRKTKKYCTDEDTLKAAEKAGIHPAGSNPWGRRVTGLAADSTANGWDCSHLTSPV